MGVSINQYDKGKPKYRSKRNYKTKKSNFKEDTTMTKVMRIKSIKGGKIPQAHNGNWMDCYVREIGVLAKDDVPQVFNLNDPNIKWSKESAVYLEGDVVIVKLGFALELLKDHELHILPRSGTFRKHGLILTNSEGIGDDSFIGDNDEYMVMMYATRPGSIEVGDRLIHCRVEEAMGDKYRFKVVDSFGNKDRGGYGSTGK